MTEPQQPDRQPWSAADLPVLTEIDDVAARDGGVEIPDFDFSSELDDIKTRLGAEAEPGLDFPPELLLEDVVVSVPSAPTVAGNDVGLDFDQMPSLDLDSYAGTPLKEPGPEHDFEFEFEPAAPAPSGVAEPVPGGFDSLLARAVPQAAADDVPELSLPESPRPETKGTDTFAGIDIPDLSLGSDVVPDVPAEAVAAAAAESAEPAASTAFDELVIPDLPLSDAVPDVPAEAVAVAAAESAEAPASAEIEELAIPDLPLSDAVPDVPAEAVAAAAAESAEAPASAAIEELAIPDLPLSDAVPDMPAEAEAVAAAESAEPAASAAIEELAIPDLPQSDAVPDVPAEAEAVAAAESAEPAASAAIEELAIPDLPLGDAVSDRPVETAAAAAVESIEPSPLDLTPSEMVPVADAAAAPFQSISLDSLPRGVLGGGLGLAAAEAEQQAPSVQDMIRAAEKTLAEERAKQSILHAEPALEPALTDTPVEAAVDVFPAQAGTEAVELAAAPAPVVEHRPVEIINVAGLASSPAPQVGNLPPVRKSYVTLVDEAMLIDSLYDKILPRMKVELSLWLQDALDHQAKQMLSGVMHQLKEDYEMLFSETLRESLRQAIAEMGREDRGDRF